MIDLRQIKNLADVVRYGGRHYPQRIANVFHGHETTYGTLDKHTNQVANALIGQGCAPQDHVAILSKNSDIYFEVIFGTAKARAITVSVNWRLTAAEIEFILNDAQSRMLFVSRDYYALIESIEDKLISMTQIVALDGGHARWPAYAEWRDRASSEDPALAYVGEEVVVQMYTSGTIGNPKGVQLTNDNFIAFFGIINAMDWMHFDEAAKLLTMVPLFHGTGLNTSLMSLAQGGQNFIEAEFDARQFAGLVEKYGITHATMVPAIILFILQTPGSREGNYATLQYIMYGAAPIAEDLLKDAKKVFGCEFGQVYGLTETNSFATCLTPEDHNRPDRLRSCGRPLSGVELRIVKDDGSPAKQGEVGEILLRGANIMKGYWNRPEANREALKDGWFHTGDAAYTDEDGYLYIFDRIKEMIVSGGENVYPAEVENALFAHPKIADVAVIGVPDEKWGEAVKAVVVPKQGSGLTDGEVISFARERIAAYKCPKSVDFIDALPRNASGKILRRKLREPYWAGQARQVGGSGAGPR